MVDIIKRVKKTCVCPRCKTELAYTYEEIALFKTNIDYLGDYDTIHGITCPVCTRIIGVSTWL